ncbi:hypothetical protein H8A95_08450 [Bradyrhizobium sp. Pear76]|uniref:hypothetical protein n=1 Tax=Bradyrhizobium oropedii TaxID=1571201 RepID=UPI001E4EB662|nr:hypothetical protein [Bradyrhizobium oropedii]MCC8962351.1 hypothetical protein [Bradyrhizobium oropedii]
MSKTNDIFGQARRPTAADAVGRPATANDQLVPVMQSVIALINESAGLVRHVAALGIAVMMDIDCARPRRRPAADPVPATEASNIIRFPTPKTT